MDDIAANYTIHPAATASSAVAPVLELKQVKKSYGALPVLQGLDLKVEPGEVYGFLGRNGAGKSTTLRLLMGISSPDAGQIILFGQRMTPRQVALRQRIGYVAQEQNFYPWMSPKRLARFLSGFYPRWDQARFIELARRFELPPDRRIGTFSGGMKAKLALTSAMAVRPDILLLDEPTAGMDPVARREFLDLVHEQAAIGDTSTLFSTHVIDDIEVVANRIGIIESGRAIYEGPLQPLQARIGRYSAALEAHDIDHWPFARDPIVDMAGADIMGADISGDDRTGIDAPGSAEPWGGRVLQDVVRGDRRLLVLEFESRRPPGDALKPGWRAEPMSLEDVFIATVAGSHGAMQRAARLSKDSEANEPSP